MPITIRQEQVIFRTQVFEGSPPAATDKFTQKEVFMPTKHLNHLFWIKEKFSRDDILAGNFDEIRKFDYFKH